MNNSTIHKSDRAWETLCHLSGLLLFTGIPFGNILGPLIVWLARRNGSPSVDEHGKEALNFQISLTLYFIALVALTISLMLVLVGFLFLPLVVIAALLGPFVDLIFMIIAAVKAGNGELYRYPLTIRFIK